jgi:carbon-monoxide dehydrogenase medium subunit
MKAPDFRYHRPSTLEEAVALLGACEDARVLAGGQSLMPMLNLRVASPGHLIDLGGIASLAGIDEHEGELLIGAMTTQRALELSPCVAKAMPLLAEAVAHVGHQQTRNRGTIGGSLCHLDPGAELPVVAAALDAILIATGPGGSREIRFADFAMGYLTSSLAPDEILTSVRFPRTPVRTGVAFLEFNRRPADFAIVSVAVTLSFGPDGRITRAAIALGGSYATPVRLSEAEAMMAGHAPDESLFTEAAFLASAVPCDGDDLYPGDYRQELAGTLVARALRRAAASIGSASHG